jgi:hypothetical protein
MVLTDAGMADNRLRLEGGAHATAGRHHGRRGPPAPARLGAARVSQYVALTCGSLPLYDELRQLLAEIPAVLRAAPAVAMPIS